MTILIATSMSQGDCLSAEATLRAFGVSAAQENKADGAYTPADIGERYCRSHDLEIETLTSGSLQSGMPVGGAWKWAASNLILSNAYSPTWGWASREALLMAGFWRELDERCRFLLLYSSPAEMLADQLAKTPSAPQNATRRLKAWQAYHQAMLQFYQQNSDTALLAHCSHLKAPGALAELLENRFGLPKQEGIGTSAPDMSARPNLNDGLNSFLASDIVRQQPELIETFEMLEASADLPTRSATPMDGVFDRDKIWREYAKLRESEVFAAKLKSELETERHQRTEMQDELNETRRSMDTVRRDIADKQLALREAENRLIEQAAKIERIKANESAQTSLTEDYALLKLQMAQVQEELQYYFSEYQKLKQNKAPPQPAPAAPKASPADTAPPAGVVVDLSSLIDGKNWHHAESEGRWTGPESPSTIRLKDLQPGRFRIELLALSAMSLDILNSLAVNVDGQKVALKKTIRPDISGRLRHLRRIKHRLAAPQSPYPVGFSGVVTIRNAQTDQPTMLEIRHNAPVSPASQGSTDTRHLGIQFRHIKFIPV